MSNIERRMLNEEVKIRKPYESRSTTQWVSFLASRFLHQSLLCTWYFVLGTCVLLLDTNYLILFFNVECRTPIGEWRGGLLNKVRSTKYQVWSRHAGSESTLYLVLCTWYNEVLLLDTGYLILILVPRTWYIVLRTLYINYFFSK